jgi:hypothetical protein
MVNLPIRKPCTLLIFTSQRFVLLSWTFGVPFSKSLRLVHATTHGGKQRAADHHRLQLPLISTLYRADAMACQVAAVGQRPVRPK